MYLSVRRELRRGDLGVAEEELAVEQRRGPRERTDRGSGGGGRPDGLRGARGRLRLRGCRGACREKSERQGRNGKADIANHGFQCLLQGCRRPRSTTRRFRERPKPIACLWDGHDTPKTRYGHGLCQVPCGLKLVAHSGPWPRNRASCVPYSQSRAPAHHTGYRRCRTRARNRRPPRRSTPPRASPSRCARARCASSSTVARCAGSGSASARCSVASTSRCVSRTGRPSPARSRTSRSRPISSRSASVSSSRHRRGPVAFDWQGRIEGGADGRIVYTLDGSAGSTFLRNRIGLCVLHPVRVCRPSLRDRDRRR